VKEKICATMSHVEKTQNVFQEELTTSNANVDGAIKAMVSTVSTKMNAWKHHVMPMPFVKILPAATNAHAKMDTLEMESKETASMLMNALLIVHALTMLLVSTQKAHSNVDVQLDTF
jgi:hypothetical protein